MAADSSYFEAVCNTVLEMTKSQLKWRILNFNGPPRLDFTEKYLDSLDLEKLRHILLAALLVHRKHAS